MRARTLASRLAPVVLSFVASCGSSTPKPLGTEGAACYGPETDAGGTLRCNEGLTCQANVCVRPAGGGGLVDSASEPLGDAAPADATDAASDAVDGGAPVDASTDADGGAPADGNDVETSADGFAAEGGADAPDASASDGAADDGASDVPPDAVLDLGPG